MTSLFRSTVIPSVGGRMRRGISCMTTSSGRVCREPRANLVTQFVMKRDQESAGHRSQRCL
jgi:hypothetical protein